ncbi:high mobility group protein 1.2-like [Esox lucius]|uniref:High mobility group protein B2 n=2 Tax=Esox lucius TaxID=8010 RepID=A0A3P8XRB3_ESOLU|nr:high mobility group protein 1.2-like [Esox lucius]
MKCQELSETFRDKVVQRYKLGEGYKKISNTLGIPLSTVKSIIKKWKVYGTTETLPRSGRPSKISSWAKKILALELTMRPTATLKELQTSMAEMGENVHESTIARSFANCSRNGRSAQMRPSQTNDNLESRMAFAVKHLDYTDVETGKNPSKPRGMMSSYAYFVQMCREEHKKKHPEASINFSEFSKTCSERWKAMTAKERGKFEDLAKLDKLRYEREMKSYVPPKGEKKKKKKLKQPIAPKRPPTAFFIFCADLRPQVKVETPGLSIGDVAKKLGEKWNKLSAEDKVPYEKKAAKLKEKYEKDITAYRNKGKVPVSMPAKATAPAKDDDDDDDDDHNEDGNKDGDDNNEDGNKDGDDNNKDGNTDGDDKNKDDIKDGDDNNKEDSEDCNDNNKDDNKDEDDDNKDDNMDDDTKNTDKNDDVNNNNDKNDDHNDDAE